MSVGDLVRFKEDCRYNPKLYPYQTMIGIVMRFEVYHPVVCFGYVTKTIASQTLEVVEYGSG